MASTRAACRLSCWISTGNEAGLGLADFIQYFLDDPVVQVIALYAEDIRRPQEFIDIAGEALRRGKPIVMMHPGRGAKAKEAARSHTGALAGDHGVMRTLVERAGVVVVDTLDELVDVSEILARFPKPSKGDLGILTFSGAFCGIAHDFCEDIGVRVPPLSPDTLAYLTPILPEFLPPKNPLDLGTQTIWQPELLRDLRRGPAARPGHWRCRDFDSAHQSAPCGSLHRGDRRREQGEPQAAGAGHPRGRLAAVA